MMDSDISELVNNLKDRIEVLFTFDKATDLQLRAARMYEMARFHYVHGSYRAACIMQRNAASESQRSRYMRSKASEYHSRYNKLILSKLLGDQNDTIRYECTCRTKRCKYDTWGPSPRGLFHELERRINQLKDAIRQERESVAEATNIVLELEAANEFLRKELARVNGTTKI